jgi:hypothetical protein
VTRCTKRRIVITGISCVFNRIYFSIMILYLDTFNKMDQFKTKDRVMNETKNTNACMFVPVEVNSSQNDTTLFVCYVSVIILP